MDHRPLLIRTRFERLLKIDPSSKPKVYQRLFETADIDDLSYWLELILSAGIATLGLVLNSPAIVIGAMVVSPLMGPILAAGLALATSDVYLGIKSIVNIFLSVLGAVTFAALIEWFLPIHTPTGELLARTQPNLLDLGVAVFSGLVGAVVVSRNSGAGGNTLPGVAIAVALMPPLCTVGFGIGSGWDWAIISGASLLFLTNLTAIAACAFLVFYLVRMDAPEVRTELAVFERTLGEKDFLFSLLRRTGFSGVGYLGQLRWRIMMLAVAVLVLFYPLGKSLLQLRDESLSQGAVRSAIRLIAPPGEILSQQVDLSAGHVVVRLVSTSAIEADKVREAERAVIRQTGKEVNFFVRKVADAEELTLLRERIRTPALLPPALTDLPTLGRDALARLKVPIEEIWPAKSADLKSYEVGFSPEETVIRIRYQADRPLDPASVEILTQTLRARLKVDKLRLILERERNAPPLRSAR